MKLTPSIRKRKRDRDRINARVRQRAPIPACLSLLQRENSRRNSPDVIAFGARSTFAETSYRGCRARSAWNSHRVPRRESLRPERFASASRAFLFKHHPLRNPAKRIYNVGGEPGVSRQGRRGSEAPRPCSIHPFIPVLPSLPPLRCYHHRRYRPRRQAVGDGSDPVPSRAAVITNGSFVSGKSNREGPPSHERSM